MLEFARRMFKHCPMLTKFQASVEAHLQKFSQYKVELNPKWKVFFLLTDLY